MPAGRPAARSRRPSRAAPAPMAAAGRLIIVRHGERIDEVDHNWRRRATGPTRSYDPPLTTRGVTQARGAGVVVEKLLAASPEGLSAPAVLYSSPLTRALQTAMEVSRRTGLPICLAPGLASCAAAIHKRGGASHVTLASSADAQAYAPDVSIVETPPALAALADSFPATVDWIAGDGRARSAPALCVAHREAIRGLAGYRVATPYACVAVFDAAGGADAGLWALRSVLKPAAPERRRGSRANHPGSAGSRAAAPARPRPPAPAPRLLELPESLWTGGGAGRRRSTPRVSALGGILGFFSAVDLCRLERCCRSLRSLCRDDVWAAYYWSLGAHLTFEGEDGPPRRFRRAGRAMKASVMLCGVTARLSHALRRHEQLLRAAARLRGAQAAEAPRHLFCAVLQGRLRLEGHPWRRPPHRPQPPRARDEHEALRRLGRAPGDRRRPSRLPTGERLFPLGLGASLRAREGLALADLAASALTLLADAPRVRPRAIGAPEGFRLLSAGAAGAAGAAALDVYAASLSLAPAGAAAAHGVPWAPELPCARSLALVAAVWRKGGAAAAARPPPEATVADFAVAVPYGAAVEALCPVAGALRDYAALQAAAGAFEAQRRPSRQRKPPEERPPWDGGGEGDGGAAPWDAMESAAAAAFGAPPPEPAAAGNAGRWLLGWGCSVGLRTFAQSRWHKSFPEMSLRRSGREGFCRRDAPSRWAQLAGAAARGAPGGALAFALVEPQDKMLPERPLIVRDLGQGVGGGVVLGGRRPAAGECGDAALRAYPAGLWPRLLGGDAVEAPLFGRMLCDVAVWDGGGAAQPPVVSVSAVGCCYSAEALRSEGFGDLAEELCAGDLGDVDAPEERIALCAALGEGVGVLRVEVARAPADAFGELYPGVAPPQGDGARGEVLFVRRAEIELLEQFLLPHAEEHERGGGALTRQMLVKKAAPVAARSW